MIYCHGKLHALKSQVWVGGFGMFGGTVKSEGALLNLFWLDLLMVLQLPWCKIKTSPVKRGFRRSRSATGG